MVRKTSQQTYWQTIIKNLINSEDQYPPNNFAKYNTISNTPSAKENWEENDDNIGINSPPDFFISENCNFAW